MTAHRATPGPTHRRRGWVPRPLTVAAALGLVSLLSALVAPPFGVHLLVVRSGSMEPTIPTGALVLARTVDAAQLQQRDVIAVTRPDGARVMHRVTELQHHASTSTVRLKGDANPVADAATYEVARADRVVGQVPWVGYAVASLSAPWVKGGLVAGAMGLLLLTFRPSPRRASADRDGVEAERESRTTARNASTGPTAVVLAIVVTSGSVLGQQAIPAWAAWTDVVHVTGATLGTHVIPPPVAECSVLNLGSVDVNWTAVPGATRYRVFYGVGAADSKTVTAEETTYELNGLLSGGTIRVQALTDYGDNTTWESEDSNSLTYINILGLTGTCG